jgi:hypothetical protein
MRVLAVSAPLVGHAFPLLALALRSAGHEVLIATGGDAVAGRDSGLPVDDVAPGFRMGPVATPVLAANTAEVRAEMPRPNRRRWFPASRTLSALPDA